MRSSEQPRYGGPSFAVARGGLVIDAFVLASGTFSILATFLLIYLSVRSVRDARDLRLIQGELTAVMHETKELTMELHGLQCEIRSEQRATKTDIDETKRTVSEATEMVESAAGQVAEAAVQVADVAASRRGLRPRWRRARSIPAVVTTTARGQL